MTPLSLSSTFVEVDVSLQGCFNTPLEHTPKPLPPGYDSGFLSQLARGIAWGVL